MFRSKKCVSFQRPAVSSAKLLLAATALASSSAVLSAPPLIINNVAAPTTQGSGQGERAIWANAGTVGGQTVDIVGVITTATIDHDWTTVNDRPAIISGGQDQIFIEWFIYEAGTYDISTGTGGIAVVADVHVQINDVDGPANEEVYLPVCQGDIEFVRIDRNATTGRTFGTVAGRPETFSLIGDQAYFNEPISGLEIILPDRPSFEMGRTANNGFFIRLDNPTYSEFDTLDFACADFTPPTAVDDTREGTPGLSTSVQILRNDTAATDNDNPTNNNSLTESEFARASVNLIPPGTATNITTDVDGDVSGFVVPGEGTWAYSEATGELTFTPDPSFVGEATQIDYEFTNALGVSSNQATVTIFYPGLGLTKSSVFNDENADGFGQVGETITYTYEARAFGREALGNITLTETGFTGNGTAPSPVFQGGDGNGDNLLDLNEVWSFSATYALVADDLGSGVDNSATITGQTSGGTTVSDVSDSTSAADGDGVGTPAPGPDNDDPTTNNPGNKPIDADDDNQPDTIFVNTGAANAFNVLDNDSLDGAAADLSGVTLAITAPAADAGVTLDTASGEVSVAAGTPAGTYTIDYEICEIGNPNNCASARATVVVTAATPITASNDTPPSVPSVSGGSNVANVLDNDDLGGSAPDITDVDLSILAPAGDPGVTLDTASGEVSVAPGTAPGTYTISYQICETANPTNCADASVTIVVDPAPIDAQPDNPAPVGGADGGDDIINAFANDTLNGSAVQPADITATITSAAVPVSPGANIPVLDPATGLVDVPSDTPAGTYTIGYEICENGNPSNCASAVITVVVEAAVIAANTDAAPDVNAGVGVANAVNAFDNDTLNGAAVDPADITGTVTAPATPVSLGSPVPLLDPATGIVSVGSDVPAGSYVIGYEICEDLNPANCSSSTVRVDVVDAPINAVNDAVSGVDGQNGADDVLNVFDGDTVNAAAAQPSNSVVSIAPGSSVPPELTFDPATGLVSVSPGTPAGNYSFNYQLCETANPDNCDIAAVSVDVIAAPIDAVDDAPGPVGGSAGSPNIGNAFGNDTLNGDPVDPADITASVTAPATPVTPGALVPELDPATGTISVPPGTPAGTYTIGYEICEDLNPANCDSGAITVVVEPAEISAEADTPPPVNGANGAADVVNAFDNDTLNGAPVDPADIVAAIVNPADPVTPGAPVPVLDPATGLVDVPAGTPAGTYTIAYEICESLNPDNCAQSTVTVVVEPPQITASDDTLDPVRSGIGSGEAGNVLGNDTLNDGPIDPADVTITVVTPPADPGVALDTATGVVSVGPDTPPGTYSITYELCEALNPDNCATATSTVVVEEPRGAISGTVFTDQNVNDAQDPGDAPRQGFLVEVVRDGDVVASVATNPDGTYLVEDVLSGDGYSIVFTNPETGTVYQVIDDVTVLVAQTLEDVDLPIDPSGVLYDSVTRDPISGAQVTLVDADGDPLPGVCFIDPSQASQTTGVLGEYQFDLVPGASAQCPANETFYRISIAPPAGFSASSTVIAPSDGPLDPTGLASPVLVNPSATPPTQANPPYFLTFELESGDPDVIFNHIPLDPFLDRGALVVTKTSTRRTANVGDIVPYQITVQNAEAVQRVDVDVVDILPSGMRYIEGTSFVDGVALEPETANGGRELVWRDQLIPANGSVTYSLSMVIGAGVSTGEKVNTGVAEDGASGDPISNRGTAVIQIVPSSVFDCSELLGKVFEDTNYNGYQDAGEPGVPGVRLATVNGQLITTDEFGRYHIACAAVPNPRIGSNYVLKLDVRTLPLGWDVTTDNPRSARLTRGKFGELNFGVAPADDRTAGRGSPINRTERGEQSQ